MTDNLPAKLEPVQFVDKLRERIKGTLGELIPDDQWDAMMKTEVDRFFNSRVEERNYARREIPSGFTEIVQAEIASYVKVRVQKYLAEDPGWQHKWGEMPPKLDKMIEDNMPVLMREVVAAFFGSLSTMTSMSTVSAIEARMNRPR